MIVAVRDVSFDVMPGEALGVVGESGCGKTAMAISLVGLLPRNGRVTGGEIMLGGIDLAKATRKTWQEVRGRRLAMVFQDSMTSLDPLMTVGDQIAEGMTTQLGMTARAARTRALELLDEVGVPEPRTRLKQFPHQLSGGLRQRVAIAMAIAGNPDILIADEPTTALDVTIQAQILDLIRRERRSRNMALILITHDLGVVASVTDQMLVMYAGRVIEAGSTAEVFEKPRHPYTMGLMRSVPRTNDPVGRRLSAIAGSPPTEYGDVDACAFAPRCTLCFEACMVTDPPLRRVEPGSSSHQVACLLDTELQP
jgi:oligopeptide/dipeptide ABC transporter ATP-binding protein